MSSKIRAFIAVEIPQTIREDIRAFQKPLKCFPADLKWVRPENMHVTLKFLGDVQSAQVKAVLSAMETAVRDIPSFVMDLQGTGVFPSESRPRVLWIGIDQGKDILTKLAGKINDLLIPLGFEAEKRDFSAHLTLARVRSASPVHVREVVDTMRQSNFLTDPFEVSQVTLWRSILNPSGPEYSVLGNVQFKG